jgi:signal transduction histidine kinase
MCECCPWLLQVDGSISRTYGGFGLGLSIVQELVRAHGGDITVRQPGHSMSSSP